MTWRQSPYAQIAQVLLRSANPQGARWLYFVLLSYVVIKVVTGGVSTEWGWRGLLIQVMGLISFCLMIVGVGAFTVLMRLNHSVASRVVPGYVPALRLSALGIWLGICLAAGLPVVGPVFPLNYFFGYVWIAGAMMLLICTPLRWPLRWCLFVVSLVWFVREAPGNLSVSGPIGAMLKGPFGLPMVAAASFAGMALLVTRLIAEKGSPYAPVFARLFAFQHAKQGSDQPDALPSNRFRVWRKAFFQIARWAKLPWSTYADRLLTRPQPGPANAIARAELGLGPMVHWVSQASYSLAFALMLALVWWSEPTLLFENGVSMSPTTVFYIALVSVACAATSVLALGDVMLRTPVEQKLMLLLPAMPHGNGLSQMLATRHLRQAFAAWALGTAWALVLPYPDSVANYVAAFCWGTLPLVPLVLQDWANLNPPQAWRSATWLLLGMLAPISAWVALRWLHLPVEWLAAMVIGGGLLLLRYRWNRLTHFAQPLPVGRFA